jgi:hypothetical protein
VEVIGVVSERGSGQQPTLAPLALLVAQMIVGQHAEAAANGEAQRVIADAVRGLCWQVSEVAAGGDVARDGGEDGLMIAAAGIEEIEVDAFLETLSDLVLQFLGQHEDLLLLNTATGCLPEVVDALSECVM